MWRQNRSLSLSRILVVSEITLISMAVLFFAKFLWQNTTIGTVDLSIQGMFVSLCLLLVVFGANRVLDRRW